MASLKVFLDKTRISKEGTHTLAFQILHLRKRKVISTQYKLHDCCFDPIKQRAVPHKKIVMRPEKIYQINEYIIDSLRELREVIDELESTGEPFDISEISQSFKKNQEKGFLLEHLREQIRILHADKRIGTANSYASTMNRVARYINHDEKFKYADITGAWVQGFVDKLISEGLNANTVKFYVHKLRAAYNIASSQDVPGTLYDFPFRKIHVRSQVTHKRAVDESIIIKISHADLSRRKNLDLVRDIFMFSFFCRGMSFVDMAFLRYTDITDNMIYYTRRKTGQSFKVRIEPPIRRIIDKYKSDGLYILPIITTYTTDEEFMYKEFRRGLRRFNDGLHTLSEYLELPVVLTSYVARHSWATIAKRAGIPIMVISEALGHTSEQTTQIYLKSLDFSVIDNANAKLCKRLLEE